MRRRFAGQVLSEQMAVPADTLAAATEALKQAQTALKSSRGGRLGAGTQEERDEGAKAVPALPTASATPVTTTQQAPATNIAGLRSALGIDKLMSALGSAQQFGSQTEAPQFEMPQFEMPQFEMPQFETPQFEMPQFEMPDLENLINRYLPESSEDQPKPQRGTTLTVGNKSYNLSKKGGAGLGGSDIRYLQNQGWTASQIKNLSKQTLAEGQKVSPGAQKLIDRLKPKRSATQTARTITTGARRVVSRTASAPITNAATRSTAKPKPRNASKPANRGGRRN